jgi:hypothetical protein
MMRARFFFVPAVVLSATLSWVLGGCSTTTQAGLQTIAQAFAAGDDIEQQQLDPQLKYLRVQIGRQAGLMVFAGDIAGPQSPQARWYSADGVVLRLAQGRIAAVNDGARAWSAVDGPALLDWPRVAAGQHQRWREISDQQPGYRLGLARERELRVLTQAPPVEVLDASRHVTAGVAWFEERNLTGDPRPAWYAVDLSAQPARVVFGQTCLQADWCLNWQPWPPQPPEPSPPPSPPPRGAARAP